MTHFKEQILSGTFSGMCLRRTSCRNQAPELHFSCRILLYVETGTRAHIKHILNYFTQKIISEVKV
jgi:hypothetical protein